MVEKIAIVGISPPDTGVALAPYLLKSYLCSQSDALKVDVFDCDTRGSDQDLFDFVKGYDLVAFSCYVWNIHQVQRVCRQLKKLPKAPVVVLGGPEASFRSKDYLRSCPEIDAIVRGEGEVTFGELVAVLRSGGGLGKVLGLDWRGEDGVHTNPERPLLENLGELPSPFLDGILDLDRVGPNLAAFETYRGCAFKCGFCTWGTLGRVRYFPMERVLAELRMILQSGLRRVWVADALANLHRPRLEEILKVIAEENSQGVIFDFEMVGELLTESIVDGLSRIKSGFVALGLQSSQPKTLALASRRLDVDRFAANVRDLKKRAPKISVHIDLIYGLPGDLPRDFEESVRFALSLGPDLVNVHALTLLPGSTYYASPDLHEIQFDPNAPYTVFSTRDWSPRDFDEARGWIWLLRMYYRPHLRVLVEAVARRRGVEVFEVLREMKKIFSLEELEDFSSPQLGWEEFGSHFEKLSTIASCVMESEELSRLEELMVYLVMSHRLKDRLYLHGESAVFGKWEKKNVQTVSEGVFEVEHSQGLMDLAQERRYQEFLEGPMTEEKERVVFHFPRKRYYRLPRGFSLAGAPVASQPQ